MKINDIHEMSEIYRKTRKDVYEEATRPLSNDPGIHRQNKERFKRSVKKICDYADLNRYCGTDEGTATAIWHHLWTKNRYAGIRSQIATKEISDIENIFDDYERFADSDWDIEASGHTCLKGGSQVQDFLKRTGCFSNKQTIGNIPKLLKIVSVARLYNGFLINKEAGTPILDFIKSRHNVEDVWAIHEHLMQIGYRSDLTALHFMMDIGFPVIKPDVVISKIFLDWGWLYEIIPGLPKDLTFNDLQGKGKYRQRFMYTKEKMYKPVIELAREIVAKTKQEDLKKDIGWVTNNPIREFDIFLVKYGQKPEKEFGIERTLYRIAAVSDEPIKACRSWVINDMVQGKNSNKSGYKTSLVRCFRLQSLSYEDLLRFCLWIGCESPSLRNWTMEWTRCIKTAETLEANNGSTDKAMEAALFPSERSLGKKRATRILEAAEVLVGRKQLLDQSDVAQWQAQLSAFIEI